MRRHRYALEDALVLRAEGEPRRGAARRALGTDRKSSRIRVEKVRDDGRRVAAREDLEANHDEGRAEGA